MDFGGGCAPPRLTLLSPAAQGCPSGLALRAEGPGVHGRGESRGGTPQLIPRLADGRKEHTVRR